MSDPRFPDRLRRLNRSGATARATPAAPMWSTLWTWLAAVAAALTILGLVYGYSRSDLLRGLSGAPETNESPGTTTVPSAPASAPQLGDARPSPTLPAAGDQ